MNRYRIAFLILGLFCLLGCGQSPKDSKLLGGVNVGNGARSPYDEQVRYDSPYQYQITYAKVLTRTVKDEGKQVIIDNSELVKSKSSTVIPNSAQVSSITFKLLEAGKDYPLAVKAAGKSGNIDKLLDYLSGKDRDHTYEVLPLRGVKAVYWEDRTNTSAVKGEYYIALRSGEIILATVDAHEFADGILLVTPIINTLGVDVTGPQVKAFRFDFDTVNPRSIGKLYVQVVDQQSGVRTDWSMCATFHSTKYYGDYASTYFSLCGMPKAMSDDWYELDFDLANQETLWDRPNVKLRYLPSGDYYLSSFDVSDVAGNFTGLRGETWNEAEKHYVPVDLFRSNNWKPTALRVPHLRYANPNKEDITPPVIEEVKWEKPSFEYGERVKLLIRAHDDLSGIERQPTVCGWVQAEGRIGGGQNGLSVCGKLESREKDLGKDWYSITFPDRENEGRFIPSGTFYLSHYTLADLAGNTTSLMGQKGNAGEVPTPLSSYESNKEKSSIPLARLEFHNKGPIDVTPPKIEQVKLYRSTIHLGEEKGYILVKVSDEGSGVRTGQSMQIELYSNTPGGRPISEQSALYPVDKTGWEGWYYIPILTNYDQEQFSPGGDYFVRILHIYDNAGNAEKLTAATWETNDWKYHDKYFDQLPNEKYAPTELPVLIVHVVR